MDLPLIQDTVKNTMLDIRQIVHQLIFRVFQHGAGLIKIRVNGDIAIPVDAGTEYAAPIFFIEISQITAAAGKADAERCLGNNNNSFLLIISVY